MNHPEPFIDIHCHLLPGLDDGPAGWEESLAMAEMAAGDGIVAIVATPHQLGNYPQNTAEKIRANRPLAATAGSKGHRTEIAARRRCSHRSGSARQDPKWQCPYPGRPRPPRALGNAPRSLYSPGSTAGGVAFGRHWLESYRTRNATKGILNQPKILAEIGRTRMLDASHRRKSFGNVRIKNPKI